MMPSAHIAGQGRTFLPPVCHSRRILVIGYGNPGRQDDGLGPAAAAEIAKDGWRNVTTVENYQLTLEDTLELATHDYVWFIDATLEGSAPCAVRRLQPVFDLPFTSHLLKPETLLAIAGQQFGAHPEACMLSIRGYIFGFQEGLSGQASANLRFAVALLRRLIGSIVGEEP